MGKSSNTSTTTSSNSPPSQFLNAYTNTYDTAQNVSNTPYQQYSGNLVAGLSPDTTAGISAVENAQGISNPYINSAANYINSSTTPLWSNTQQWSPSNVNQYMSPYTQDVVNATQAEFNNQNQQQQNQLAGNAVSSGAFGGDRAATAAASLAGQQQLTQAPTIAGLYNQGFSQAQGELNQQQAAQLGANEAQAWLNSQAGYGMANLGNQALSSTLTGANALLNVGSTEQQQAQSLLNVPYEQYTAQQAYPYQTTSWLSGIASGLGSNSGGSSTSTNSTNSGNNLSSVLGTGLVGLGATGAFGSNGYLTGSNGLFSNLFGSGSSTLNLGSVDTSGSINAASALSGVSSLARGGLTPHRASGGSNILGLSDASMSASPNQTISTPSSNGGVPDVSVSYVPAANTNTGGTPLILKNYGSTSTTSGGGGGINASSALGDVASIASIAALVAARGGRIPHNDNGWEPRQHRASAGPVTTVSMVPSSGGQSSVPQLSTSTDWLSNSSSGPLTQPTAAAGAQGQGALSSNSRVQNYLVNQQAGASFQPATIYSPSTGTYGAAISPPTSVGFTQPGSGTSQYVYNPASAGSAGTSSGTSTSASSAPNTDPFSTNYAAWTGYNSSGSESGGAGGSGDSSGGNSGGMEARGGTVRHLQDGGDADQTNPGLPLWAQYDSPQDYPSAGPDAPRHVSPASWAGTPSSSWSPGTVDRHDDAAPQGGGGPPQPTAPQTQQADSGVTLAGTTTDQPSPGGMAPSGGGSSMEPEKGGPDHGKHPTDWNKMLLLIGANMMAGRSRNAAQNVGAGIAAGMKQYESEDVTAERLANQADDIVRKMKQGDERNSIRSQQVTQQGELGQQKLDQGQQRLENTRSYQDRVLQLRQQGLSNQEAAQQARQEYQQQSLALRQQAMQLAHTDREKAFAQRGDQQQMSAALNWMRQNTSRDPVTGKILHQPTLEDSMNAVGAAAPSHAQAPVAAAPPQQAIDALKANPSLAPQFKLKYGVDPQQFLQQQPQPANEGEPAKPAA